MKAKQKQSGKPEPEKKNEKETKAKRSESVFLKSSRTVEEVIRRCVLVLREGKCEGWNCDDRKRK